MFFYNSKYSKNTLNIYLNQEKNNRDEGVLMVNLILRKGIDLTKERVKEEIKKRSEEESTDFYTRVVITQDGKKFIKSITIFREDVRDPYALFNIMKFNEFDSMEFLS